MYIPPRPIAETYKKYEDDVTSTSACKPLGERHFSRVFNRMLQQEFVCPLTHKKMRVEIRTHKAPGFKICKKCEDYRMLLWNCKNSEKKEIYKQGLQAHWQEHEDGRDVYHDHQNYCKSSGGTAVSVAIDAADQAKFGVFSTAHRGMQDAYLKVKQKITGALVHGFGYFLFRCVYYSLFPE